MTRNFCTILLFWVCMDRFVRDNVKICSRCVQHTQFSIHKNLISHSVQSIQLARKHQNTHPSPSVRFTFLIRSIYLGNKTFLRTPYSVISFIISYLSYHKEDPPKEVVPFGESHHGSMSARLGIVDASGYDAAFPPPI